MSSHQPTNPSRTAAGGTNTIGTLHYESCSECRHSDDYSPCSHPEYLIDPATDSVLCERRETEVEAGERMMELMGDCARDEA